jgi:hypothetical protein
MCEVYESINLPYEIHVSGINDEGIKILNLIPPSGI